MSDLFCFMLVFAVLNASRRAGPTKKEIKVSLVDLSNIQTYIYGGRIIYNVGHFLVLFFIFTTALSARVCIFINLHFYVGHYY